MVVNFQTKNYFENDIFVIYLTRHVFYILLSVNFYMLNISLLIDVKCSSVHKYLEQTKHFASMKMLTDLSDLTIYEKLNGVFVILLFQKQR